jgi:conjugative relaxase-like TrwC/TraI family protein
MLRISKPLNSGKLQSYHALEYTSPSQSYYQHGDTIKGEWQGQLATQWGLTGEVGAKEFTRLSEGQHPLTADQLVRHRKPTEYTTASGATVKAVAHRAGWDATFSPSKSVSLTALVGGDDRIREAHRQAVTTALDELEKYTQARLGGNRPAETTGKFLVAKFEHDTARPVDGYAAPQLHTHAVIFNVTERGNGQTRAIDADSLFESQQYATAIYQSELMYRLRSLGYEIEPGRSGAPDIKGYSADYLDISSQRHQKIEEALAKAGAQGHEAAEIAAHATRERKQELTPGQVLAAHREVAEQYGNQPQRVVAEARQRVQEHHHTPDRTARAHEAVTYARSGLFEREAVADERLIFRDALRRGMGETTYSEVRKEFDTRREQGEFRSVEAEKYASGRSFTTPETIAAERSNVSTMRAGQNAVVPIMSAEAAQQFTRPYEYLNDSQRRVVEESLNSPDRMHGLQGRAGVGKTEVLKIIRAGAESEGFVVQGFAPTSRATGQLRDAEIAATTLQSFLAKGDAKDAPPERHLYMLDEASLTSTRQMRSFLERLKPDDRVLIIGDTRQHQAVDAGRPFQQLQEAGMRTSQLDKIMRQKDPELLKAVEHLSRNETQEGIALLRQQDRISEVPHRQQRIEAIAKDYASSPERTLVVSPDNKSRQEINDAVRAALREKGMLSQEQTKLRTLVHRSDMTGADRTWAGRYNVGDIVQYTTGSDEVGLKRNSMATVRKVDARANSLTVERQDGTTVSYDPRRLRGVHVFQEVEREFSVRDRIQFTASQRALNVANRDLGTIASIENGRMTVALDGKNARTIAFDTTSVRQFDHGYAVTSHSSQGLTTTRVLAHFDTEGPKNLINTRLAYVAISRASHDAHIYTNDIEKLGKRLSSDVSKAAAVDFKANNPSQNVEQAIAAFRTGESEKGRDILQKQGRVQEYASPEHRMAAIALDFSKRPEGAVLVVADPGERHEVTRLIRDELMRNGKLHGQTHAVSTSIQQDFGTARLAARYAAGDTIRYKAGDTNLGIAANSEATVLRIDSTANRLAIRTRDGGEVSYNPAITRKLTGQSTVFRNETRDFAVGDRVHLAQAPNRTHARSGGFATIERIGKDSVVSLRYDNGRAVQLAPDEAKFLEHGYAVKSVAEATASRVLVAAENDQFATHTKMMKDLSPHTHDVTIYTAPHANQTLPIAAKEVGKQGSKSLGLAKTGQLPSSGSAAIDFDGFGVGR